MGISVTSYGIFNNLDGWSRRAEGLVSSPQRARPASGRRHLECPKQHRVDCAGPQPYGVRLGKGLCYVRPASSSSMPMSFVLSRPAPLAGASKGGTP